MNDALRQIRFPLILLTCFSLAFPPELVAQSYDAAGRLIATIDARGNRIRLTHNVEGNAETVYDQYGNATTYFYNDRGNVTAVVNAMGYTTTSAYEDPANPDNATAITDPLGNTTYYEYDSAGRTTKITDPAGDVTTNNYDGIGNLLETVQYAPNPRNSSELIELSRTTLEYNYRNLPERTSDAAGNVTQYVYDSKNRLLKTIQQVWDPNIEDVADVNTTNTYNDPNFPPSPDSTTEPAGFTRWFEYDKTGSELKSWYYWQDPNNANNNCKVYSITEYDAAGRAVRTLREVNDVNGTVSASVVTLSQTWYNSIDKPCKTIDEFGVVTAYEYDELGNTVETKSYDSNNDYTAGSIRTISQSLYDKAGRAIVAVDAHAPDANANGTQTVYDVLGRAVESRRWADVNVPVVALVVDSNVVGRTNVYDVGANNEPNWSRGRLLGVTKTEYDIAGNIEKTIEEDEFGVEQVTYYEYDMAGRKVSVTDSLGNVTEYEYQGSQRTLVRSVLDGGDRQTKFGYDSLGRPMRTTYPDGSNSYISYDSLGRRTAQTDQAGRTRRFEYDKNGRLTAVILSEAEDPNNGFILTHPRYEFEYDVYGNLITVRDNVKQYGLRGQANFSLDRTDARETKFTYNEIHKQTGRILHDGKTETKVYDANGLLIKAMDLSGHVTGFEYNSRGLLEYRKFYDSNSLYPDDPNAQFKIAYDKLSRQTSITVTDFAPDTDVNSVYQCWYDAEGRIEQLFSPQGYVRYGYYDNTSRMSYVYTPTIADSNVVDSKLSYFYDALGRLEEVEVNRRNGTVPDSNEIITYAYDELGSLESIIYPAGNYVTYSYDLLNRLTRLIHYDDYQSQTPTELAKYEYTLAADGKRTSVTELDGTVINWTYDALNRLIAEDYNAPSEPNDFTHTYVYDLVSNRLEKQVTGKPNTTYVYNDNDQLLQETTDGNSITYGYDLNGSLVTVLRDNEPNSYYTYNLQSRMASASDGTDTVTYRYNPDGIRVDANDGTTLTKFLIDPYNHTGYAQVFRANTVGGSSTVYINGLDVIAQATGTAQSAPKYLLYDGHGSVRHLADYTGAITESYAYDAYGNAHGFNPSAAGTSLLYTGEFYDSVALQYYLRNRWYRPSVGLFNRMDDFSGDNYDPQSLHKYLYAYCDPINNIDPTGRATLADVLATSMIIGSMMGSIIGGIRSGTVKGALIGGVYGGLFAPAFTIGVMAGGLGIASAFGISATTGLAIAFGISVAGSMAWNTYEFITAKNAREKLAAGVAMIFTAGAALYGGYRFGKISSLPNSSSSSGVLPSSRSAMGEFLSESAAALRGQRVVARQVTIQSRSGIHVRIDMITKSLNGKLSFIDSKFGPSARFTTNQKIAYPEISRSGGIIIGNKGVSAGLPAGTEIGPTDVYVDTWNGANF